MIGFTNSTLRRHIIAYWVTTALVVSELALGGVWDVLRVPRVRELIAGLGYPHSQLPKSVGGWSATLPQSDKVRFARHLHLV